MGLLDCEKLEGSRLGVGPFTTSSEPLEPFLLASISISLVIFSISIVLELLASFYFFYFCYFVMLCIFINKPQGDD